LSRRVAAVLGALLALGCSRAAAPAKPAPTIVFRDGQGAVVRELVATPFGYQTQPDGARIQINGRSIDAGAVTTDGAKLQRNGQPHAAIERAAGRVQLYGLDRAPLGQLVERGGEIWAYDPGGAPLGRARSDGDRVVLVDRDGAAKGYATGVPAPAAAAWLLAGGLDDLERTVLVLSLR
jgi:hypothetical protein